MRILGLIVARANSKRVPGKNYRDLGGKPLIAWSIDTACESSAFCDILVSTDSEMIANLSRSRNVLVPWMRPAELALDETPTVEVALHALNWYESEHGNVDGLFLLQPTSPYRSTETIRNTIQAFTQHGRRPVVAMRRARSHPEWMFTLEDGRLRRLMDRADGVNHIGHADSLYEIAGCAYVIAPADLRERKSFFGEDIVPYVVEDEREGIDIDTEWDWHVASTSLDYR